MRWRFTVLFLAGCGASSPPAETPRATPATQRSNTDWACGKLPKCSTLGCKFEGFDMRPDLVYICTDAKLDTQQPCVGG